MYLEILCVSKITIFLENWNLFRVNFRVLELECLCLMLISHGLYHLVHSTPSKAIQGYRRFSLYWSKIKGYFYILSTSCVHSVSVTGIKHVAWTNPRLLHAQVKCVFLCDFFVTNIVPRYLLCHLSYDIDIPFKYRDTRTKQI